VGSHALKVALFFLFSPIFYCSSK